MGRPYTAAMLTALIVAVVAVGPVPASGGGDLLRPDRLQLGVGDRIQVKTRRGWSSEPSNALARGLDIDLFQVWLPRGWRDDWVPQEQLRSLTARGITPVLVHYYFGDFISRERVESRRKGWYSSLWRMAKLVAIDAPVLVVLEPEFNIAPPPGETAITDWPGFADDLRAAAQMIRKIAPNALIGVCPGDFLGPPDLERVLGPLVRHLDFIGFQEMRAGTDRAARREDYLDVGRSAVDFARYLKRAFGLPVLVGYVAVSSHGGWEKRQAEALRSLVRRRKDLLDAGVFGVVYFQLRDDPKHTGYFGPAEKHFGLLRADGSKKPAFEVFQGLGSRPAARSR